MTSPLSSVKLSIPSSLYETVIILRPTRTSFQKSSLRSLGFHSVLYSTMAWLSHSVRGHSSSFPVLHLHSPPSLQQVVLDAVPPASPPPIPLVEVNVHLVSSPTSHGGESGGAA